STTRSELGAIPGSAAIDLMRCATRRARSSAGSAGTPRTRKSSSPSSTTGAVTVLAPPGSSEVSRAANTVPGLQGNSAPLTTISAREGRPGWGDGIAPSLTQVTAHGRTTPRRHQITQGLILSKPDLESQWPTAKRPNPLDPVELRARQAATSPGF